LSHEKRNKFALLADSYPNLIVLADEVYHMLSFEKHNLLPMCYYHKNFISMGSFSKTFAPYLRLGWIHAHSSHIETLAGCARLDSGGGINPQSCAILHKLIKNGNLLNVLNKWKLFLKTNCDILYNTVITELTDYIEDVRKPNGGYFLWIKLKPYISTVDLSGKMEEYKIKFHHGNKFSSNGSTSNYLRISFSWYNLDEYILIVQRLKELLSTVKKPIVPIYVLGDAGKLGKLIIDEIYKCADSMKFIRGIGRDMDLSGVTNDSVIIDVSQPDGTTKLLKELLYENKSCPVIIGTTGHADESEYHSLIKEYGKCAVVAKSSNFSKGIVQFKKIIDVIDKTKWNVSMIETHHITKKDAPSGTAKMLSTYYDDSSKMSIKSIREGDVYGEHELILDGPSETIKIVHIAKSRQLFAEGCIDWINYVIFKHKYKNFGIYYELN
jgi:4-hydroxy-tetrahydrodipicolinate reductase